MTWMLKLYPRGWRRRYAGEVEELIASEQRSLRLFLDLLAGAVDARLNPQWTPATADTKGNRPVTSIRRLCASSGFTKAEQLRSAAVMLGASAGFALLGAVLTRYSNLTLIGQAVLYAGFPMAVILSSWGTFLKPYRQPVRWTLLVGGTAGMFLFMLAVAWLADRS